MSLDHYYNIYRDTIQISIIHIQDLEIFNICDISGSISDIYGRLLPELSEELEIAIFPIFAAEVAEIIENIRTFDFSDISESLKISESTIFLIFPADFG